MEATTGLPNDAEHLAEHLDADHPLLDTALDHLAAMVAIPTVSLTPNVQLIDHAQRALEDLGAICTRTWDATHSRANLLATIGPHVDGGVVLSGHTDVVPADDEHNWVASPWQAAVGDGRVYGRGTTDMKGFIACVLAAAEVFSRAELVRPVHVALSFDEEIGCQGAPLLLADLAARNLHPAAAIIGEPTMLDVITAHKGCHEYTTTITGLAGHGSMPDRSVNAIWHAARYVMQLHRLAEQLRDRAPGDSVFDPPETTLSIGTIGGGQFRNVVPGACSFDWEYRPVDDDDAAWVAAQVAVMEEDMDAQLRALHPAAGLVSTCVGAVGGLRGERDSPAVVLVDRLLDNPVRTTAAYSTEAGLFQKAGIPAVVCGPGSIDQAHRVDEYIAVDQLVACLHLLERLAQDLATTKPTG